MCVPSSFHFTLSVLGNGVDEIGAHGEYVEQGTRHFSPVAPLRQKLKPPTETVVFARDSPLLGSAPSAPVNVSKVNKGSVVSGAVPRSSPPLGRPAPIEFVKRNGPGKKDKDVKGLVQGLPSAPAVLADTDIERGELTKMLTASFTRVYCEVCQFARIFRADELELLNDMLAELTQSINQKKMSSVAQRLPRLAHSPLGGAARAQEAGLGDGYQVLPELAT